MGFFYTYNILFMTHLPSFLAGLMLDLLSLLVLFQYDPSWYYNNVKSWHTKWTHLLYHTIPLYKQTKSYKNIPLAQINSNFAQLQDNCFSNNKSKLHARENQSRYIYIRTLTCTIFLPNKSTFTPKYLLTLVSLLPYKQQRSLRRRGG